jgi:hypothetical protein
MSLKQLIENNDINAIENTIHTKNINDIYEGIICAHNNRDILRILLIYIKKNYLIKALLNIIIKYKRYDILKIIITYSEPFFPLYELYYPIFRSNNVDAYDILIKNRPILFMKPSNIRSEKILYEKVLHEEYESINIFDRLIQFYNNSDKNIINESPQMKSSRSTILKQYKKYIYDRKAYTSMIDVPEELIDIICEYFVWD